MTKRPVPQGTQKKEPLREVVVKTFNLAEMESAHSRKLTKWKVAKKLNLKRWVIEVLREERLEVSSLGTPQNKMSARGFWGKSTKRRKLWETRKGPATKVAGTTWALVPREAKEGNQWYPKTLGWHYKRGSIQQWRGIQQQGIRIESLRKLCQKTHRK